MTQKPTQPAFSRDQQQTYRLNDIFQARGMQRCAFGARCPMGSKQSSVAKKQLANLVACSTAHKQSLQSVLTEFTYHLAAKTDAALWPCLADSCAAGLAKRSRFTQLLSYCCFASLRWLDGGSGRDPKEKKCGLRIALSRLEALKAPDLKLLACHPDARSHRGAKFSSLARVFILITSQVSLMCSMHHGS